MRVQACNYVMAALAAATAGAFIAIPLASSAPAASSATNAPSVSLASVQKSTVHKKSTTASRGVPSPRQGVPATEPRVILPTHALHTAFPSPILRKPEPREILPEQHAARTEPQHVLQPVAGPRDLLPEHHG
jgi:hypothetical protein